MGRVHGHQQIRENKWASGSERHFTSSSTSPRKDDPLTGPSPPIPKTASPWSSDFGLQTAEPRPVFSPNNSYTYKPSSIQRQPSHSEFYVPRSNSDLLVGSINQRDQYAMDTPLAVPLDTPLPPPPPLLSGGRLGAIILLYVLPPSRVFYVESKSADDRQHARRPSVLRHGHDHRLYRTGDDCWRSS